MDERASQTQENFMKILQWTDSMYRIAYKRKSALLFCRKLFSLYPSVCVSVRIVWCVLVFMNNIMSDFKQTPVTIAIGYFFCIRFDILPIFFSLYFSKSFFQCFCYCGVFYCITRHGFLDLYLWMRSVNQTILMFEPETVVSVEETKRISKSHTTV